MAVAVAKPRERPGVKTAQVALPVEHGGWSFLFEPIIAGLALAFSVGGLWISLLMIGAFLLRRPLSVWLMQVKAGRRNEYRELAIKYIAVYSLMFAASAVGVFTTVPLAALVPLMILLPIAAFQLYCDVFRQNRKILPEIAGGIAMSSSVASLILAGSGELRFALAVWVFFALRIITSVLYVRNRLDLEKGKPFQYWAPQAFHIIALTSAIVLAYLGELPFLAAAAALIFFMRSAVGLSRYRTPTKAMKIGIQEVIFGIISVLALIVGQTLGV